MVPAYRGTGDDPGPDLLMFLIALLPVLAALLNYYAAVMPLLL